MNTNIWLAIIVLAIVMGAMIVLKPSDSAMSSVAERQRGPQPRFHIVWSRNTDGWQLPVVSTDR
ncbi:MAG: hypothetical protein U0822_13165 [Anaerolineae bacterium]